MRQVINESKQLNEHIRASEEYRTYLRTKQALLENEELSRHLQEFRAKNYDLQNRQGVNPYDEMIELTREYDELLHNSVVSDFLQAEQQICKLLQQVFDSIASDLNINIQQKALEVITANEKNKGEKYSDQIWDAEEIILNDNKAQLRPYHKYIAIIKSDGDSMGETIKSMGAYNIPIHTRTGRLSVRVLRRV